MRSQRRLRAVLVLFKLSREGFRLARAPAPGSSSPALGAAGVFIVAARWFDLVVALLGAHVVDLRHLRANLGLCRQAGGGLGLPSKLRSVPRRALPLSTTTSGVASVLLDVQLVVGRLHILDRFHCHQVRRQRAQSLHRHDVLIGTGQVLASRVGLDRGLLLLVSERLRWQRTHSWILDLILNITYRGEVRAVLLAHGGLEVLWERPLLLLEVLIPYVSPRRIRYHATYHANRPTARARSPTELCLYVLLSSLLEAIHFSINICVKSRIFEISKYHYK